ncbi:hypothetical protein [Flavivirga algicola]|uniref:Lipoprotein n=1 Tax=Flavivirga algicola TaxID=2729136 RepID=A0ABX1S5S7_9FLAO|nr:hypothetical protein [Flavivirga algicola]NMH89992.1 hypothetical protein [Flavivirga algicola]
MRNIYKMLILLSFAACNEKVELEKLSVSENLKREINNASNELGIICYFQGDCSICYGNIMNINKNFSDTPLIIITQATDTVLINYNLDKIDFKGKLIIDSTALFYKKNENILKDNKLLLVNPNYDILDKSKFLMDNEIIEKFKYTIINYDKEQ